MAYRIIQAQREFSNARLADPVSRVARANEEKHMENEH